MGNIPKLRLRFLFLIGMTASGLFIVYLARGSDRTDNRFHVDITSVEGRIKQKASGDRSVKANSAPGGKAAGFRGASTGGADGQAAAVLQGRDSGGGGSTGTAQGRPAVRRQRKGETIPAAWRDRVAEQSEQAQTSDNWPLFSKNYFPGPIPRSPFYPNFTITWDFDTKTFLKRPDVQNQPPKLITWMVKTRYTPELPEPVRLRLCPEMPCRMTTNRQYRNESAALLWAGQIMRESVPPVRSHPDQVYIFHNHESQRGWIYESSFRKPAWKSAFNWTMTYRDDSDIQGVYGKIAKRKTPWHKNYTDILTKKSGLAVQLVSNCKSMSRREDYVRRVQKVAPVDVYGSCSTLKCPRHSDHECYQMMNTKYKFLFAFENAICKDYISEKFFRYMDADFIVVARGSHDYEKYAPPGTFINTADFESPEALGRYLLFLDQHTEEYLKILRAKNEYEALYEDWPLRDKTGQIYFMTYHYHMVSFCDMCRRLWNLDDYRKTVPDIVGWFDRHNCRNPTDL